MKKRSHVISLALLVAFALLFPMGCKSDKQKAQDVLSRYVVAEGIGNYEVQKDLMAKPDREIINKKLEKKKSDDVMGEAFADLVKGKIGDEFEVEVTKVEVDGEKMKATADVTRPDESKLGKLIFGALMKAGKEKDASDEEKTKIFLEELERSLAETEFETEKNTETFQLRKEEGKWKVFGNLKAKNQIKDLVGKARDLSLREKFEEARKKIAEAEKKMKDASFPDLEKRIKRAKASVLSNEAKQFARDDKLDEAIANYEEIVEMKPGGGNMNAEKAQAEIDKLKDEKKKMQARKAYRENIGIDKVELHTRHSMRYRGAEVRKWVSGEVENNGDKTLNKLELLITFFDEDGNEVHTATESAVYASNEEAKALKSGHSEEFSHHVSKAPDAWDGETVEVEVSEIEFFGEK